MTDTDFDITAFINHMASEFDVDPDELQEACAVYNTTLIPLMMGTAATVAVLGSAVDASLAYLEKTESLIAVFAGDGTGLSEDHDQGRIDVARRVKEQGAARAQFAAALAKLP